MKCDENNDKPDLIWNPRKMSVSSVNYPYIYKIFFVRPSRRIQRIPMQVERWYSSVIHLSTVDNPETTELYGARCLSSAIRFYVLFLFISGLSSLWKIYLVQSVAMMHSHVLEQLIEITRFFLSNPSQPMRVRVIMDSGNSKRKDRPAGPISLR